MPFWLWTDYVIAHSYKDSLTLLGVDIIAFLWLSVNFKYLVISSWNERTSFSSQDKVNFPQIQKAIYLSWVSSMNGDKDADNIHSIVTFLQTTIWQAGPDKFNQHSCVLVSAAPLGVQIEQMKLPWANCLSSEIIERLNFFLIWKMFIGLLLHQK